MAAGVTLLTKTPPWPLPMAMVSRRVQSDDVALDGRLRQAGGVARELDQHAPLTVARDQVAGRAAVPPPDGTSVFGESRSPADAPDRVGRSVDHLHAVALVTDPRRAGGVGADLVAEDLVARGREVRELDDQDAVAGVPRDDVAVRRRDAADRVVAGILDLDPIAAVAHGPQVPACIGADQVAEHHVVMA